MGCRLLSYAIHAGRWEAVLEAAGAPEIELRHLDRPLPGLEVDADGPGRWRASLQLPAALMTDGVQSVFITDIADGRRLAAFSVAAGTPLQHDMRAEIALLRAELDMLKRAFRRHCTDTAD